jgi:hypothetical protein
MPEDVARPLARRRRAEATALPAWIKPQLTKLVDQPPDGPKWLHELKFDGYLPDACAPRPWRGPPTGAHLARLDA